MYPGLHEQRERPAMATASRRSGTRDSGNGRRIRVRRGGVRRGRSPPVQRSPRRHDAGRSGHGGRPPSAGRPRPFGARRGSSRPASPASQRASPPPGGGGGRSRRPHRVRLLRGEAGDEVVCDHGRVRRRGGGGADPKRRPKKGHAALRVLERVLPAGTAAGRPPPARRTHQLARVYPGRRREGGHGGCGPRTGTPDGSVMSAPAGGGSSAHRGDWSARPPIARPPWRRPTTPPLEPTPAGAGSCAAIVVANRPRWC